LIRIGLLPLLSIFGVEDGVELKIKKRGALPGGGGEVQFLAPVVKSLKTINFVNAGRVKRIRGIAHAVRVSPQFSNRMVDASRSILNRFIPDIYIHSDVYKGDDSGKSPGYALSLLAETTEGALFYSEAVSVPRKEGSKQEEEKRRKKDRIFGEDREDEGPVPVTPEDVALRASRELLLEVQRGGCVDRKHQWIALLYMVLGSEDVGKIRMGPLTVRSIQFLRDLKETFGTSFKIVPAEENGDGELLLSCYGTGYTNISLVKTFSYASLVLLLTPIFKLITILIRPYFSPLRELRGPPGGSWITGHINDLNRSEKDRAECHLNWVKEYGHVYVYKSLLNGDRLTTTDPKALNHILANYMNYYKPVQLRLTVGQLIGEGLIFAEGAAHKRQRRVMNPSFSLGHIREMTELFFVKALEMRDALSANIEAGSSSTVNIIPFISRCTLDIIGLAGFNTDFNTVKNTNWERSEKQPETAAAKSGNQPEEATSDLADAFAKSFRTDQGYAMMQILLAWIPPLRSVLFLFDSTTRAAEDAQATMRRIGRRLVEERKRELGFLPQQTADERREDQDVNATRQGTGKDLLSLMIKANMSPDVSPEQRMTDAEVMHQIPTFMVAGHETTATGLVWALYSISLHPDVQSRLRTELYTLSSLTPTMDELNELSYFDAV
ncbi:hypothetical protein FRC17_006042, partial [Serendipita sp. 399]